MYKSVDINNNSPKSVNFPRASVKNLEKNPSLT